MPIYNSLQNEMVKIVSNYICGYRTRVRKLQKYSREQLVDTALDVYLKIFPWLNFRPSLSSPIHLK